MTDFVKFEGQTGAVARAFDDEGLVVERRVADTARVLELSWFKPGVFVRVLESRTAD